MQKIFLALLGCGLLLIVLGGGSLSAAAPTLTFIAPTDVQPARGRIDIPIRAAQVNNLGAWEFDLEYDPRLLTVTGVTIQPFFGAELNCRQAGRRCAVALGPVNSVTATQGVSSIGAVSYGTAPGAGGAGIIAILHLTPTGRGGTATLRLINAQIADTAAIPASIPPSTATITLRAENRLFLPTLLR